MKPWLRNFALPVVTAVATGLLVSAGAQGAFWQWSKTAASNATADPSINWSEGMSPSSVNDSARAMMARAAEYRDDISGSVTTGGTSTAYTATSNQGLNSTPTDGQLFAFTAHATNGVAPTLTVDGGNTYPLQSASGAAVSAATLIAGTPYQVKFSNSNSAWMLLNFYASPNSVPIGMMAPYTGSTVPNSNFVMPAGQCISRTTYAAYFAQVGTTFGTCDGSTTFGVIDLRAQIPVALDNMGGTPANRLTSDSNGCGTAFTALGATCANGNQSQTLNLTQIPAHTHTATVPQTNIKGGTTASASMLGVVSGSSATTGAASPADRSIYVSSQYDSLIFPPTGITTSSQGGGTAHPIVMPVIGVYWLLRVI